jgi:hypothetical protein
MDSKSTEYINSVDYKILEDRIKELDTVLDDLKDKSTASRKLRYADLDVEAERLAGRLAPDELYIPQHIIDTNIRREQASYVQFVSQSPRAVILEDRDDSSFDLSNLEKDLTSKMRYEGWQLSQFANIDGLQANGYGVMEIVYDSNTEGGLSHESVQYGDFAFLTDTRDIQAVEMPYRCYYFTKTRLTELCGDITKPDPENDWDRYETEKVINSEPTQTATDWSDEYSTDKKSLYCVKKVMFRVQGIVHVAWCCPKLCNNWLRKPRPLYIGRRKVNPDLQQAQQALQGSGVLQNPQIAQVAQQQMQQIPQTVEAYETNYPYILFPYLISENDTIANLHGRVYLDQDLQEAVSSLISSVCTQSRRASGLYFSKNVDDPNDDILMQKNVFFKSGSLINSKVQAFDIKPPDPATLGAIQQLIASNQNETSQVNFAVQNRKDSRKTAKEIEVATDQATVLSTVQVVLYSMSLRQLYTTMAAVIKSRVLGKLITVTPELLVLYQRNFNIKPAGDVDVIEKQKLIQTMMNAWPVIQQTPAAQPFLIDLIEMMFPTNAAKYLKAFQQAAIQAQSQQAQQQQQLVGMVQQLGEGIINLDRHREYFSESGLLHAYPVIEDVSRKLEEMKKQQMKAVQHNGKSQPQLTQ